MGGGADNTVGSPVARISLASFCVLLYHCYLNERSARSAEMFSYVFHCLLFAIILMERASAARKNIIVYFVTRSFDCSFPPILVLKAKRFLEVTVCSFCSFALPDASYCCLSGEPSECLRFL